MDTYVKCIDNSENARNHLTKDKVYKVLLEERRYYHVENDNGYNGGWDKERFVVVSKSDEDKVNNPAHYTMGKIEVYDFIKAWELSFAEGNVIKYVVRAPHKGKQLEDLKKARWYLDQLIKEAEQNA